MSFRAKLDSLPLDSAPRYEPVLELGRGGMGQVFLARAVGTAGFERLVALKRMSIDVGESDELLRRFIDEARVAAQVRHANVVAVHHFGRDAQGLYLVLDYVEGVSLQGLIDRAVELGTRPPAEIVLRVIADALAGLHAVHEASDATGRPLGILHRDVSVQNVLIGRDGVARLSDFGVAKSAMASAQTAHNHLVGKLLYMPPEYLQRADVDRRLDVYAMGLTLWIALAGVEPWGDDDDVALVGRILRDELPSLASVGASVAPELEAIVRKACAKDLAQRYATAAEMNAALTELTRRTGWMAVHDEVAAFVQATCGRDMARVREQVARVSSWPPAGRVSDVVPSSARRWSVAGAQKIRIVPRSTDVDGAGQTVPIVREVETTAIAGPTLPSAPAPDPPPAVAVPGSAALDRRARVRIVAHTLVFVGLVLSLVLLAIIWAS